MEEYYMMWLSRVTNVGIHKVNALLDYFGTAEAIWNASEYEIQKVKGVGMQCSQSIQKAKNEEQLQNWIDELEQKDIQYVSIKNERYPNLLKQIFDPPIGLYVRGFLPDENMQKVSMVGARKCSNYGSYVTHKFAKDLAKAKVVIERVMATGIDCMEHKGI